jgi:putative MFS transporter
MGRDVSKVLEDIGLGPYHCVQLLLIGGVMISDGAEILVSSSLLNALKSLWDLTPMERGLMMSTIFVGVFLGGLIGGSIADAYGRRRAILFSYIGLLVFGTSTAAAQGPISMLILRFLFGASFGCGMGPGMALQVETSSTTWRAHIVNIGGLWFAIGEIYTAVLLILFMPDLTDPDGTRWRWVTLLSMVPGFLLFPFTYFLLQESPFFLVAKGRRQEAARALQYIGTMNHQVELVDGLDGSDPNLKLELPEGVADADSPGQAESAGASLLRSTAASSTGEPPEASASAERSNNVTESIKILLSPDYRSIMLGGCYLCFLANFLFYGLTYALPQIFSKLHNNLEPAVQVLIISICDLPGAFLAFFFIYSKSIGHRDSMAILCTAAAVFSLTLISIDHGDDGLYIGLPSAYLVKYVSSAFFTLVYVYLAEVFPSKVRASGVSACIASGRVGSIASPLIVEALHIKDFKLGEHAPFMLVTSFLCMLAIVVIKFMLYFEMKNEPLTEDSPKRTLSRRASKASIASDKPAPAG